MRRYKIIVNPTAGRGAGASAISRIRATFRNHGLYYDLVETERPMHAADLAQQAAEDGFDVVVACGGDGTVNEVLNGLMRADNRTALGVLCVGRGNDFAFGAGIPQTVEEGIQALADDRRKTIDIGCVRGGLFPEGRYFANGVGIGFDAVVGFEAKKLKRLHGFLGYFVAALRTIFLYFDAPTVRIEHDADDFEQRSLMISIMNGRRMGGGFMMAPDARNDDGYLSLCIAEQVTRGQTFALIPRFMRGTQASHPAIRTGLTSRILVTALAGHLPAHADGETISTEGVRLAVEIMPQRIDVVVQEGGAH